MLSIGAHQHLLQAISPYATNLMPSAPMHNCLMQTPETTAGYQLLGWLVGQSVLNHAPLGVSLPPLLMAQLMASPSQPFTLR